MALVVGATSANAQKFISIGQNADRAVKQSVNLDQTKVLNNTSKSNTKSAAVTVDFNVPTEYACKALTGHTAGPKGTFARFDTITNPVSYFQTNYPKLYQWLYLGTRGFYYFNRLVGDGIGNGFAMVAPRDQFALDGNINNKIFNTAVELTVPATTTGWNVVDVEFNQYTQRFNSDKYFVDWSTSPTFATYDSIEFNVKGIEMNSNEDATGSKRVTLPTTTSIGQTALYVRLRYSHYGGTTAQPAGYFWIVDSITISNGPAVRLDVKAANHGYNAYHVVPLNLPLDTLLFFTTVDNTGGDTLTNVYAQERMHSIDDITVTPYTYTYIKENRNNALWSPFFGDRDTIYPMGEKTLPTNAKNVLLSAGSSPLYNNGNTGYHMISSGVQYSHNSVPGISAIDTMFYEVSAVEPLHAPYNSYRWAADYNMLFEGVSASYGLIQENGTNYITDDCPSKFSAGFEVCTRFMPAYDTASFGWYFKGIEVVPAVDSCQAGVRIQGSLKKIDWVNFPGWDNALTTVATSNVYTVSNSDLNNGLFTDATTSSERTRTFNTIFLPLTDDSLTIAPNNWYYACYKLLDDGMFIVGSDSRDRAYTFAPDDDYSCVVNTPGLSNYSYGDFFGSWLSNNSTPMVRAFVSQRASSINDIPTSVFNVRAYPNPAQNETNIEYTLNNNGNVVITVADIMGREVIRMNQGNQSANSTKNVTINTSNLSNGTYFYTINVNGVKQTNKLVINK